MSDSQMNSLQYFVIIAEQKKKNKFITLLNDHGARVIETVYGRGSMSPSAIASAFGFEAEAGKVLITCLIKTETARKVLGILYNEYNFHKPNTGIAFGIPVGGLSF